MHVAVYGINHSAGIVMRNKKKSRRFTGKAGQRHLKLLSIARHSNSRNNVGNIIETHRACTYL